MIIAEFSHNHQGKTRLLKEMVKQSADCGVTIAKIQTHFAADCNWSYEKDRVADYELDWDQHRVFVELCREHGLIPMTSVYSFKYAERLFELGFRHIKIGSAQSHDQELIQKYSAVFKTCISTGGRLIREVPKVMPQWGVLHCVSKYPHSPYESNLSRIVEIKKKWPNALTGFSSHVNPLHPDWDKPLKASLMIAEMIEVHFSLLEPSETKDGPVSVCVDQLKELGRFNRLTPQEKLLECPKVGMWAYPQGQDEKDLIKKYESRWNLSES